MRLLKVILVSLAIIACTLGLAWTLLVPRAIEREARARLRDAGFAHAAFSVGRVALDRVELLDVALADGLNLGDIEIDAGPYALWRGRRADLVLRGPRVDAELLAGAGGTGRPLPFREVVIEDGELVAQGQRIAVRGTIDLRGSVDLVAAAPEVVLGSVRLTGVAATARGPLTDLRLCATGQLAGASVDACASLDARAEAPVAALTWNARDDAGGWSARGSGRLVRARDSVALEAGVVDAIFTHHQPGLAVDGGSVHLEVAGDLGTRTYTARGTLTAATLTTESVTLRDARLPLAITGRGATIESADELAVSATSADVTALGRALRIDAPLLVARGAGTLGALALAAGDSRDALQLVTRVHGVPLDRVLRAASRDRVHGSGLLDGELVFAVDDGELALVGGGLAARAPGRLVAPALAPPATTDLALYRRIAGALADFAYSRLTVQVVDGPFLQLSLEGRGRRVAQPLAIDVNVRGLLAHHEEKR